MKFLTKFESRENLPQRLTISSDWSEQSDSMSQTHLSGMHNLVEHLNWFASQSLVSSVFSTKMENISNGYIDWDCHVVHSLIWKPNILPANEIFGNDSGKQCTTTLKHKTNTANFMFFQ